MFVLTEITSKVFKISPETKVAIGMHCFTAVIIYLFFFTYRERRC